MNASVTVEAEALQRIFLLQSVARHFPTAPEHGDRRNDVTLGQLPVGNAFCELLGIDFDLARRGRERILHRILAEGLENNAVVVAHAVLDDAFGPELIKARELVGIGEALRLFERLFVAPAQPLGIGATFRVGVFNTEALGHFTHDFPVRALLPLDRRSGQAMR